MNKEAVAALRDCALFCHGNEIEYREPSVYDDLFVGYCSNCKPAMKASGLFLSQCTFGEEHFFEH